MEEDDEGADDDHDDFGGDFFGQQGTEGGCDDAADEQAEDDVDMGEAEGDDKGDGGGEGGEELGEVDRADGFAGGVAGGDEGGGDDGSPSAAADGIHCAANQAERDEEGGFGVAAVSVGIGEGFIEDAGAHDEQVDGDVGLDDVAIDAGEDVSSEGCADDARDEETPDEFFIDIAESPV